MCRWTLRIGLCGAIVLMVAGRVQAGFVMHDDFNDGVLDSSLWVWSPNGQGGECVEGGGYLTCTLSDPSPYRQVRTAVDAMDDIVDLEVRFNPASVAGNKNIGFWWGEVPDDPALLNGFYVSFNGTRGSLNVHHVTGAQEESPGRWHVVGYNLIEGLYPNALNEWHTWQIAKTLDTYAFYRDGIDFLTYTPAGDGPTALHWAPGYHWNLPRDGETGVVQADWITITPEPSALALLACGMLFLRRRR